MMAFFLARPRRLGGLFEGRSVRSPDDATRLSVMIVPSLALVALVALVVRPARPARRAAQPCGRVGAEIGHRVSTLQDRQQR